MNPTTDEFKEMKCQYCENKTIVESFVTKYICGVCDKRITLEEQYNKLAFKSVFNLKQHNELRGNI